MSPLKRFNFIARKHRKNLQILNKKCAVCYSHFSLSNCIKKDKFMKYMNVINQQAA